MAPPKRQPNGRSEDVELVTSPLVIPAENRKVIADIVSHRYEKVYPKHRQDGIQQTFNFEIESSEKELTDLQDTFIYFRWSIKHQNNDGTLKDIPKETYTLDKDEDGLLTGDFDFTNNTQLVSAEPAAPLSMIQDAYLSINDVPFPAHTQGLYFYSLYWRLLLETSPHARETCLKTDSHFIPRTPGFHDEINPSIHSGDLSLLELNSLTSGSKEAETLVPLLTDWTSFRRAIPPGTKLDISLDRARCLQYIISSDPNDSKTYDIDVQDVYLIVKRLTMEPLALTNYHALLNRQPAIFPYVGRHMRALDIPKSSLLYEFEIGSQGSVLPFLIRFGLVRKKAFEGSYTKSVYNFERFGLQQIRIKEANGFISSEINISDRNDRNSIPSKPSFLAISEGGFSTDKWLQKGSTLNTKDFGLGYAIYTLDLSRSATSQDPDPDLQSSPRREKVTVSLDFLSKTPYDVVLILEEQHNKVMRMGGDTKTPSFD